MRKHPNFASLRAFEAAARLESFAAAAEELHQTPSAISHQIRNLESLFGTALFVRHSRHVELTEAGARLSVRLTAALNAIEGACAELMPDPGALNLSVHCSPSFASKWLGPRMSVLMKGDAPLSIRLTSNATPIDLGRHEEIDIAITYGPPPERQGITVEPLGEETVVPMAAPALGGEAALSVAQLARLPLIDSQLSPIRWPEWFRGHGRELPRGVIGPSFDRGALVISAAVDGLGVALESVRFAEDELASGKLRVLQGEDFQPIQRRIHFLCYRAAQRDSLKVRRFREWLLETLATSPR